MSPIAGGGPSARGVQRSSRTGYSQHAGQVIVADGTADAARRLSRVLTNDPAMGVYRHADAGYEAAEACAREQGLVLPMSAGGIGGEA